MSNTKIFVTGAGGFVGKHLCSYLAARAYQVVAVSRKLPSASPLAGVETVSLPFFSDESRWQRSLTSIRCVVHLAGLAHQFDVGPTTRSRMREVNVGGARFVAEQAALANIGRFVFVSSIKVNGDGNEESVYDADDRPNPVDAYAVSKLEAEMTLREICARTGMELVIIRPPLIYGPAVGGNFTRLLRIASLGIPLPFYSINNRRSLIGITNLSQLIETCVIHRDAPGEVWLVSDGEDLSTPALIRKMRFYMGKSAKLFSVSPSLLRRISKAVGFEREMDRLCGSLRVNSSPARERLAWRPLLTVDDELRLTVDAFMANRPR